jgi:hypothetical protein
MQYRYLYINLAHIEIQQSFKTVLVVEKAGVPG